MGHSFSRSSQCGPPPLYWRAVLYSGRGLAGPTGAHGSHRKGHGAPTKVVTGGRDGSRRVTRARGRPSISTQIAPLVGQIAIAVGYGRHRKVSPVDSVGVAAIRVAIPPPLDPEKATPVALRENRGLK